MAGKVTKITNFGVFVELEPDLEGLLHISELSDQKVETPKDVVKVGDDLEVKILRVDTEDRKIGLSLKRAQWAQEEGEVGGAESSGEPRRGGLSSEGGMLGDMTDNLLQTIRQRDGEGPSEGGESADDVAMEALNDEEGKE